MPELQQLERLLIGQRLECPRRQLSEVEDTPLSGAYGREQRELDARGPTREEHDDFGRLAVDPVRVVDQHEERLLARDLVEQREHAGRRREPVRFVRVLQRERCAERAPLPLRECLDPVEHGPQERVERGVRKVGLGLDAACFQDPHAGRLPACVLEQRALSDPRLAREDEDAAPSTPCPLEQRLDLGALLVAPDQHG